MKTGKSTGIAEAPNQPFEPAARIVNLDPSNHDDVALLAYAFWQERGCPLGSDQDDWFRAQRELKLPTVVLAIPAGSPVKAR